MMIMPKEHRNRSADDITNDQPSPGVGHDFFNKPLVHAGMILFITFLVYANTFSGPFVFEDVRKIVNNVAMRDLGNFWPPAGTQWFGSFTFAVNYRLGQLDPSGYHIVNLAIHVVNALLLYWLVVLTLDTPSVLRTRRNSRYLAAFFAAILFACHPVQTQAVTYISQRTTSLATLLYLLSLTGYVKFRILDQHRISPPACHGQDLRSRALAFNGNARPFLWYIPSIISAVLAMKTREIAFTLPFAVILYEFSFFNSPEKTKDDNTARRLVIVLPFILTLLLIPLDTYWPGLKISLTAEIRRLALQDVSLISAHDYLLTEFRVIVTYIRLLFCPINQNLDYDYPVSRSIFDAQVLISLLVVLSIILFGIYAYRKSGSSNAVSSRWWRLLGFGIIWYFMALSVESSILPEPDVISEHRVYLPSVGFFLAVISAIELVGIRWGTVRIKLMYGLVLAGILFSIAAFTRNARWIDSISLWQDTVKKSPGKLRPHMVLGAIYLERGHVEDAISEYAAAVQIAPDAAEAHNMLGAAYEKHGDLDKANSEYIISMEIRQHSANTRNNAESTYLGSGNSATDSGESRETANAGTKRKEKRSSDPVKQNLDLAAGYLKQGQIDMAISTYISILKIDPDHAVAHNNLGAAYEKKGNLDNAIKEYLVALQLDPSLADTHNNLGAIYVQKGRLKEAMGEFREAIRLKPDHARARRNLDILLLRMKRQ